MHGVQTSSFEGAHGAATQTHGQAAKETPNCSRFYELNVRFYQSKYGHFPLNSVESLEASA
jgi:hypothetical protein